MKEAISVLGIELKYISQEDAKALIEEYLNNDILNTMCVVTKEMLLYAGENPQYRQILESMDIHVVTDKDIFTAAGVTEESLLKKADDRQIWNIFVETVGRERKTCFLLAETEEELALLKNNLMEKCPDLFIVGTYASERAGMEPELIVNEINAVLPDVVLSAMEQPGQELFVYEQRRKMGAKVWFGLGPMGARGKGGQESWLARLIGKTVFNRKVQQYNNMQEEEWEEQEEE